MYLVIKIKLLHWPELIFGYAFVTWRSQIYHLKT